MSSSSSNSWTILTPGNQETAAAAAAAAETLRPLTERTDRQDEPSELTEGDGRQALSEEDHPTAEETVTKPCEAADHGACLPSSAPLDVLHRPIQDAQTEDTPVDAGPSSTEQEAFSDSYSHLGLSTEDCSTAPLTSETLGPLDSEQEGERGPTGVRDETQHQSESKELQEEASKEETEPAEWSPLKTSQEPYVQTESITAQEPELRRRRSLLEKIGRHEEEEEAEEDFQLPQRADDSGITLNKCILGAVILLGLGTIFISGVFMDLDEESEYPSAELKESEAPGQQEWLNHAAVEADSAELLNKLNKGNEQMAMVQSQLQSHNEEVKVATAQTAEGSAEQLQLEEVEKENTATTPPGGRPEDDVQMPADQQVHKKDKHDRGVREEWKEQPEWKKDKKQRKDGGKTEGKDKEKKKDKAEGDKADKKRKDKYSKHSEDSGDWKKDKSKRGDEGKPWKDKNEKKQWTDGSGKKSKHDKLKEDKEWRSREERRDFKESKHHRGKGPGDKEWERGRDGHKEEHKYERKQWKEREGYESRNRKDTGERGDSSGNGKDQKKKWKKKEDERQWSKEGEWNGGEKKHQKDWREGASEKHKGGEHRERTWSERKPPKPAVGQPAYWARQRERLQHSSKPVQPCYSPDACARAEGVRPVNYAEFEAILQNYLSKAQTAGVDATQVDELKKLAAESFRNGVFPHDQMSFQDYVEDVGDILEDLVEGEDDSGQQDSAIEDEMDGFEREVMQTFTLPGERGRVTGKRKMESGRGRA